MRSLIYTVAIAASQLCSTNLIAQPNEPFIVSASVLDKNLAKVTDSLYAYKYETSNTEYRQFLKSIREKDEALYVRYLWDTLGWHKAPVRYNMPSYSRYERHPAFSRHPAVNISYESAVEYCKWLTDLYNNDPKREFKRVLFSLPTEEEWMKAAYGGNMENLYPWGSHLRYKDGEDMCNMLRVVEELIVRDANGNPSESWDLNTMPAHRRRPYFALPIQYTQHIESYKPNGYGLYNVSGNAAEMIADKGISKGGSFNSYGGEVRIDVKGRYTETSPELGFRVFMRVVEK